MRYPYLLMGRLKENTIRVQLTDSSQLFTTIVETALSKTLDWDDIFSVTVTCETYDCRIAFGVSASTTVGHVLLADQSMRIPSNSMIRAARLINKTSGANSIIQITLEG